LLPDIITDLKKKAELEEVRDQHLLQIFITYAPVAIAMLDRHMRYVAVSRRFLSEYRMETRDLIGRNHYEVFPDIPDRWKDIHQRCLQGECIKCNEDSLIHGNGEVEWLRWEVQPWYEKEDEIGGIILFIEVITEQKKAAERLKESEEKFRTLFDKHSAVKLIIDPNSGNIVEANVAAEKFYGWRREILCKMNIQDINILSPDAIMKEMKTAQKNEKEYFEFQHRLADGTIRDVAVYSSSIIIQGNSLLHSIIHDITPLKKGEKEREKLQKQLEQAKKMESIGLLAGGVAHDYNNMLSVIIGYSSILLKQKDLSVKTRNDITHIYNAAMRSADVTRQLLAFARKQTINPIVLDINRTLANMLEMIKRLIGENIALQWIPDENLWPVRMDPTQVDQMLINLCVNARDAIQGVGSITIETKNMTFDQTYCSDHYYALPGDYATIIISDNGCGMSKETIEHLFEPFYTTKELGKGTGLGLATIYGIIKQNNGFINVYSELDRGTTIKLYLPRHEGVKPDVVFHSDVQDPLGNQETILVVEDEKAILEMVMEILKSLNYHVLSAHCPNDALSVACSFDGCIDLLLSDVVMPQMTGLELETKLKLQYPNLKTLFMSGYTSNVIVHRGILDPGVEFIQKPFTKTELARKIDDALRDSDTR